MEDSNPTRSMIFPSAHNNLNEKYLMRIWGDFENFLFEVDQQRSNPDDVVPNSHGFIWMARRCELTRIRMPGETVDVICNTKLSVWNNNSGVDEIVYEVIVRSARNSIFFKKARCNPWKVALSLNGWDTIFNYSKLLPYTSLGLKINTVSNLLYIHGLPQDPW